MPASSAVVRIPDPDYDRHPAYGQIYGRPAVRDRLRALGRFLPAFGGFVALDLISRAGRRPGHRASSDGSPVLAALARDGVTAAQVPAEQKQAIRTQLEPVIATLRAKRAGAALELETAPNEAPSGAAVPGHNGALSLLHKRFVPHSTLNELFIHEADAPEAFRLLRAVLGDLGALEAASRYQGRGLDVKFLKLVINGPDGWWWRGPFADLGLPDPPGVWLHVDHLWTMKAILYLSEVGERNGPFSYCLGSHRLEMGWLEGAARRANDRAELSACTPDERRLFSALPKPFRRKAKFGNDLEAGDPALERLLASERRFLSAEGDLLLFDDRGMHRGGLVDDGERCILQIRLG